MLEVEPAEGVGAGVPELVACRSGMTSLKPRPISHYSPGQRTHVRPEPKSGGERTEVIYWATNPVVRLQREPCPAWQALWCSAARKDGEGLARDFSPAPQLTDGRGLIHHSNPDWERAARGQRGEAAALPESLPSSIPSIGQHPAAVRLEGHLLTVNAH